MSQAREKFVIEVDSEILAAVRALAEKEGRPLQASRRRGPRRPDR